MTILVGALSTAGSAAYGAGSPNIEAGSLFVASATGSATTMSVGVQTSVGANLVLAIYNAAGTTLLGYCSPIPDTVGTQTGTLVSPVSITAGTTYLLTAMTSGTYELLYHDNTGFHDYNNSVTYSTTPPSTFALTSAAGGGFISIAASGTTGGTAYTLTAAQGSIALTGEAVLLPLLHAKTLTADFGSILIAGATSSVGYTVGAALGTLALTGEPTNLTWQQGPTTYVLTALTGVFALAAAVGLVVTRAYVTSLDVASFAINGQSTILAWNVPGAIAASQGTFVLTGEDSILTWTQAQPSTISAEMALFPLTWRANLIYVHGDLWTPRTRRVVIYPPKKLRVR